jgi:hypothetical protein
MPQSAENSLKQTPSGATLLASSSNHRKPIAKHDPPSAISTDVVASGEETETGADKKAKVTFEVPEEDDLPKLHKPRKPTGFVHKSDLPHVDDADAKVKFDPQVEGRDEKSTLGRRKPTGSVKDAVPLSDDEVDDCSQADSVMSPHARVTFDMPADTREKPTQKQRKLTGFFHKVELSSEEDDDDDDVDPGRRAKVTFDVHPTRIANVMFDVPSNAFAKSTQKRRKPTGYVQKAGALLDDSTDVEVEKQSRKVKLDVPTEVRARSSQKCRKPTGFVHKASTPIADDEDEDEVQTLKVQFSATPEVGTRSTNKSRKGTAFAQKTDVPLADSDEEGSNRNERIVTFDIDAGDGERSTHSRRKPTGFLHKTNVPDDEDDMSVTSIVDVYMDAQSMRTVPKPAGVLHDASVSWNENADEEARADTDAQCTLCTVM